MPRAAPFDAHWSRYEAWFQHHEAAYLSELLALRAFVPWSGRGLEIGVGSGRFAAPLGVQVGIDPSPPMLAVAAARGIEVVEGVAEALPFAPASFDHAVVVTTICFVDAPARMFDEAYRVLAPGACLVVGFVDRHSPIGHEYLEHQGQSVFYREAVFYCAAEVEELALAAGFTLDARGQTLSRPLPEISAIEPLQPGVGRCGFVVLSLRKGP